MTIYHTLSMTIYHTLFMPISYTSSILLFYTLFLPINLLHSPHTTMTSNPFLINHLITTILPLSRQHFQSRQSQHLSRQTLTST